jgi:hypothetical protein
VTADFDDQLSLNHALQNHAIDARWFLPFTVYRLHPYAQSRQAVVIVTLQNILPGLKVSKRLLLTWNEDTPLLSVPPVQETVVTEWAACGIACAVLPLYTRFHLVKITESGDRFDYWVGDGRQLYGLEVSGILRGETTSRKRIKERQLLANPFGVGGYVCIVHFSEQSVHLSFHLP